MAFLAQLTEICALRRDTSTQSLAAMRMVRLTLQYGACNVTGLTFALFAVFLARRNSLKDAHRYGCISQMIAKQESIYGGEAVSHFFWSVNHWRRPYRSSLQPMLKVTKAAIASGDLEHVAFRVGIYMANVLVSGVPLLSLKALINDFHGLVKDFPIRDKWFVKIPYNIVLHLVGQKEVTLKGSEVSGNTRAKQYLFQSNMITAFILNDFETAEEMRQKLEPLKSDGVWIPYRSFIEFFIFLELAKGETSKERKQLIEKAKKIHEQIARWAKNGVVDCRHMLKFTEAEMILANTDTKPSVRKVKTLYNGAIAAATRDGFLHHQAYANERAGQYFLSLMEDDYAVVYLTQARNLYRRWGALAKVRLLEEEYGELLNEEPQQNILPKPVNMQSVM